jgi:hypothetical protein
MVIQNLGFSIITSNAVPPLFKGRAPGQWAYYAPHLMCKYANMKMCKYLPNPPSMRHKKNRISNFASFFASSAAFAFN